MYRSLIHRLATHIALGIFALHGAGCGGSIAALPVEAPASALEFADEDDFDVSLSRAFDAGLPEVVLTFRDPMTTDSIPARLDRWLYAVSEKYGGDLELKADPMHASGRSAVLGDVGLAIADHRGLEGYVVYLPARGYDVTVYYRPLTGQITSVVFRHKIP